MPQETCEHWEKIIIYLFCTVLPFPYDQLQLLEKLIFIIFTAIIIGYVALYLAP